jgi:hypothetical protein
MTDERWVLLDLHDLARVTNGRTVRVKVKGTNIEVVIWGATDVQRIADAAKKNTGATRKDTEQ